MIIVLQHIYLDTFMLLSFRTLINTPTGITESTSTLIDNIFTNNFNDAHISGIFYTDISDHFPVFSILSSKAPAKDNNELTTFRKIIPSGQVTFKNDIANIEWLDVLQANNPGNAHDLFSTKIKTIYDRCFPLSPVKIKCKKTKHKPWMTQALIISCKRKN